MKLIALLFYGCLAITAFAESPSTTPNDPKKTNNPIVIQQYPSAPVPYRGAPIFDDKVFESIGKVPDEPPLVESPYSGIKRSQDDTPVNYTSTQRDEWINKCNRYRGKDSKKFRDCFEKFRNENDSDREDRQRKVEKNLNTSYRSPQSPDSQNPILEGAGFGGVDVRSDKD